MEMHKLRMTAIPIASVAFEMAIMVGNRRLQITKRDVHLTHEFADSLPYTGIRVSYVIYRPLDLPQSTWHSCRSWQKSAVTSVSSSFLPCSLCSFSSLRFQPSQRYHSTLRANTHQCPDPTLIICRKYYKLDCRIHSRSYVNYIYNIDTLLSTPNLGKN